MVEQLKIPIWNQIPLTRIRIIVARVLYRMLHMVLKTDFHTIHRNNVCYAVDLSEGIDLSLFLFGNFQDHVTRQRHFHISDDAVVFDVGANIGSMTFRFAQLAPRGHIYAFEPTFFAYRKLQHNISLNPQLSERITALQLFVSDESRVGHQLKAYASWKVDGSADQNHIIHGGAIKNASSIPAVSIDGFCKENRIQKVDVIKIDTDGHELSVLKGACSTIERFLPTIIFEVGLYTLEENNEDFKQYLDYLTSFNYILINSKNGKRITRENFYTQIPLRATTDVVAIVLSV